MDLHDKIVLAHKGYFDKESEKLYRENSKEVCGIANQKDYIGIIEVDVRKSSDGVLYCYHGSFFEYYFFLKFPRTFADLKKKYNVDSLSDVLQNIGENKILCLDLKSDSITPPDLLAAIGTKKFKEIILGNTGISTKLLDKFSDLPAGFVKIMNGNIFCDFYDLQKLKDKNYKYFQAVFPFQARKSIIDKVSRSGLEFSCAPLFFWSKESYWKKMNKYNLKQISSDFI